MAEELEASLSLSVEEAARSIDELGDALVESLGSAADSFGSEMATAVASVPEVDIEFATPDASEVTGAIDTAVDAADTAVTVDADTSAIPPALDEAFAGADTTIAVEVDESGVTETTQGVQELNEALADTEEAAPAASSSLSGLSEASSGLSAVTGLATGSTAGLSSAIGGMGAGAGIAVGAFAGVTGAVSAFYNEAVEATGSQQRFNSVLGDMADEVENLDGIKTLNTDLSTLALTLGSDDDKIRTVAARMFELATASGKSRDEASKYTQQLISLGARAIALNPELGDVGSVTDRLSTAMTRGGRFASRYGLDLNSAEINARALQMTGKATASELSFVEKSMAGATIASEKYGDNLDKIVARGAENAITIQRRLKQTIVESIEALGMPFVAPIFDLTEKAVPAFEAAGRAVAVLAEAGLPVLITALEVATPLLEVMADVLESIPTPALQAALAMSQLGRITSLVTAGTGLLTKGLSAVGHIGVPVAAATHTAAAGMTNLAAHTATATYGMHTLVAASPSTVSMASSLAGHFKTTGHAVAETGSEMTKMAGTAATTGSGLVVVGKGAEAATTGVTKTGSAMSKVAGHTGVMTAGIIGAGASMALLTSESEYANAGIVGMAASGALIGSAFPGAGTAIGAVAGLVTGLAVAMFKGEKSVTDYRNEFRKLGAELEGLTAKQTLEKFVDKLGDTDKLLALGKGNVRAMVDEVRSLGSTSPAAAQKVVDAFIKMRAESDKPLSTKQIAMLNEAVEEGAQKFGRAAVEKQKDSDANTQVAQTALAAANSEKEAAAAAKLSTEQFVAANEAMVQTASSGLPTIAGSWQELGQTIKAFGKDAVPDLNQLADKLNEQADTLIQFPNRVSGAMRAGYPAIAKALTDMGPVAGAGFAHAVEAAIIFGDTAALTKLNDSAIKLSAGTAAFGPAIAAQAPAITTGMASAMDGIVPTLALIMGVSQETIRASIPGFAQAASATSQAAKDAFTFTLAGVDAATAQEMADAQAALGVSAPGMSAAAAGVGTETTAGYTGTVAGMTPATTNATANAAGAMSGSPIPGAAGSQGQQAVDQFGAPIKGGIAAGVSTGVEMGRAAFDRGELKEHARGVGHATGRAFGEGLEAGILARAGDVAAAAAQVVNQAEAAARAAIDAKSPSRVMMRVGEDMGEGVAIGIVDTTAMNVAAMRSVMSATAAVAQRVSARTTFGGAMSAGSASANGVTVQLGPFNVNVGNAADAARAGRIIRDEAQRGVMNALTRRAAIIGARG